MLRLQAPLLQARRHRTQPVRRPAFFVAYIGLFWLLPSAALAQQVVITLDGIPATTCNETWTEQGVTLSHVNTAPEDCDGGGNCTFLVGSGQTGLAPGRLELDLTTLAGPVTSAQVDFQSFCGVGCARAFLYEGAVQVDSASNAASGVQTVTLDPGGNDVDRLGISVCEGSVFEVRLQVGVGGPAVPGLSLVGLVLLAAAATLVALRVLPARRRRA